MFQKFFSWKKHHGIEVFGATLALLLVLLTADVVGGITYTASADRDYLSGTPYYSSTFLTSRSQVEGNIVGFYTNEANTKVAIMVHMPDAMMMSSDAMDYQMFVRGFNVSKGSYAKVNLNYPSGGYYVFGTTGYAMIYLVNMNGFAEQALEVIVRNNNLIKDGELKSSSDAALMEALKESNETYSVYDQYRLIINPSASGATVVDFLEDMEVEDVFRYCVLDSEEAAIRAKLYEDVGMLNDYMREINEYKKSLERMNVHVPKLPESIIGDTFVNCKDGDMCEHSDHVAIPYEKTDDEGNVSVLSYPVYVPGFTYPRGVDFDWQHTLLSDKGSDFFSGLLVSGQTKEQYLRALQTVEYHRYDSAPAITDFSMLDGTPLNENMSSSLRTDEQQIYNLVRAYTEAVSNYLTVKRNYQTVDMVSYLTMQYNMEISGKAFTSNLVDGVITVWP